MDRQARGADASPPTGGKNGVLAAPAHRGEAQIERLQLDDGLTLVRSRHRPLRALREEVVNGEEKPTLVITFCLSGESHYVARDGTQICFRSGQTTLSAFSASAGERRFVSGQPIEQLRLVLGETGLKRYLSEAANARLAGQRGVRMLGQAPTPRWCKKMLRPLLAVTCAPPIERHIAALGLLAEYLRPLQADANSVASASSLRNGASEKIARARELMRTRMDQALTIPYLCAAVGLNEFDFKRGFREQYGITPHQALIEMRMRRAWRLLASGCQVSQTGWQVGYAHPANFSAAFSKHFGQTPKSVFAPRTGEDTPFENDLGQPC